MSLPLLSICVQLAYQIALKDLLLNKSQDKKRALFKRHYLKGRSIFIALKHSSDSA